MDTQVEPSMISSWARRVSGLTSFTTSRTSFWARMRNPSDVENGDLELEEDGYKCAKAKLFAVMTNQPEASAHYHASTSNAEFLWYLKFLEHKLETLVPCIKLEGKDELAEEDEIWYKKNSMEVLELLARILTSPSPLPSLDAIRLKVLSSPIFQSAASNEAAYTIIFSMIGWLSMIYQPSQTCHEQATQQEPILALEMKDFQGGTLQSDVYRQRSMSLREERTFKLPLSHVFVQFGKLLPGRPRSSGQAEQNLHLDLFQEQLVVSYLNFQTLYEVAEIRIAWVDSLSLHLDFDERSQRLKVFRFPSFCKLMCKCIMEQGDGTHGDSTTYLSSLFSALFQTQMPSTREPAVQQPGTLDFYREALLTYRLIFGQKKRSQKAWRSYCSTDAAKFDPRIADPLLPVLCGRDYGEGTTYTDIQAQEVGQQYSAQEDFPFFGDRLLKVQQFVVKKNPGNWRTMWNDRRDLLRFWTFWAVVIVGGASLVLSIIQNIEGAVQIAYAVKQSN